MQMSLHIRIFFVPLQRKTTKTHNTMELPFAESWKIKMVEPIRKSTRAEREQWLCEAMIFHDSAKGNSMVCFYEG